MTVRHCTDGMLDNLAFSVPERREGFAEMRENIGKIKVNR